MDVVFLNFLTHYGGPAAAIAFVVLFGLVVYRGEIKSLFARWQKPKKISKDSDPKELLRATIRKKKRSYQFTDPQDCVQQMLMDLLKIRYTVFERHINSFERFDKRTFNEFGLYSYILSVVYDAIADAEKEAKDAGIHHVVISVVRMLTLENANVFMAAVRTVCESKDLSSNEERIHLIYGILNETIRNVGDRAEQILRGFAHELEGFRYKSFVCGRQRQEDKLINGRAV